MPSAGPASIGRSSLAREAGARVVIINAQPTPYDDIADAVLRESIGRVLPQIVGTAS